MSNLHVSTMSNPTLVSSLFLFSLLVLATSTTLVESSSTSSNHTQESSQFTSSSHSISSHSLNLTQESPLSSSTTLVERSSITSNLTQESSLSTPSSNATSYILSNSGTFAFGFYPTCQSCNHYTIGTWLANSCTKPLIWSVNRETPPDGPIANGSSLLLNRDGLLRLRSADSMEKPLIGNLSQPVSYIVIEDSGDLVMYNSDSMIIWRSFDHPTDTIVQGQTLKTGYSLVSLISESLLVGEYKLIMDKSGDLELLRPDTTVWTNDYPPYTTDVLIWKSSTHMKNSPILLILESTGDLNLVDWEGLVIKILHIGGDHVNGSVMYRAVLGEDGKFRLYQDMLGSRNGCEKSVMVWEAKYPDGFPLWVIPLICLGFLLIGVGILFYCVFKHS